ncbi:MAG: hypothetical protein DHS20C21_24280 [Gemmatimonadota bacterium]|nr:MAG: hypothetical protein DHS20C21_24280 [Gemmatimonadota bacterium]
MINKAARTHLAQLLAAVLSIVSFCTCGRYEADDLAQSHSYVILEDSEKRSLVPIEARKHGVSVEVDVRVIGRLEFRKGRLEREIRGLLSKHFGGEDDPTSNEGDSAPVFIARVEWETVCNGSGEVLQTICHAAVCQEGLHVPGASALEYDRATVYATERISLFGTAFNPGDQWEHAKRALAALDQDLTAAFGGDSQKPLTLEVQREWEAQAKQNHVLAGSDAWAKARERGLSIGVDLFAKDQPTRDWLATLKIDEASVAELFCNKIKALGIPATTLKDTHPDGTSGQLPPMTLNVRIQVNPLRMPPHAGGGLWLGLCGNAWLGEPVVVASHRDDALMSAPRVAETRLVQLFDSLAGNRPERLFDEVRDECLRKVCEKLAE